MESVYKQVNVKKCEEKCGSHASIHLEEWLVFHPSGSKETGKNTTDTGKHNQQSQSHFQKDIERQTHTLTLKPNPISLDGGKKLEYPEGTHANTRRTCKLHTESPHRRGHNRFILIHGLNFYLFYFILKVTSMPNNLIPVFRPALLGRQERSNWLAQILS